MKGFWIAFAIFVTSPLAAVAGTPDQDVAVKELYLAYRDGVTPPLSLLNPDTIWHCTYFQAERDDFYRASTFLKFYNPRKDGVIRSVTRVTYPRRVSATTYFAFTSYGMLSLPAETNIYSSIRQTGPAQLVIEYFQTQGPLNSAPLPKRAPALTAPGHGTSFAYAGCLPMI